MNNTNTGGPAFPRAPFEYIDNGNGLEDAQVASKEEIINRAKLYMMKSPQEKNT
jgi:hypothetical protein